MITLQQVSDAVKNHPNAGVKAREFGKSHIRLIELDMDLSNRFDFLRHTENELSLAFMRGYAQCLHDQAEEKIANYGKFPG